MPRRGLITLPRVSAGVLIAAVLMVACQQESARPRSVEFFKEDSFAREGVLARCNEDRAASESDRECANARRAAAAVATERALQRKAGLEAESERKLEAMRERADRVEQAEREAQLAAEAAAKEAYEAQWRDPNAPAADRNLDNAPSPINSLSAPTRDDDVYELESLSQVPSRPELELAAVTPPKGELAPSKLEIERSAIVPRPFRDDGVVRR